MKRAVIVTGKYVQDHEYIYPFYRLQEAGFSVDVAVKNKETVQGFFGTKVVATCDIKGLKVNNYDVLILPGGAKAMEYLRQDEEILKIIRNFYKRGKVIASICHGSQLLISARIIKGKNITGYYSIKDDINNAGAKYIDRPVVVDGKIVTSPHYKYLGDWMREV